MILSNYFILVALSLKPLKCYCSSFFCTKTDIGIVLRLGYVWNPEMPHTWVEALGYWAVDLNANVIVSMLVDCLSCNIRC